MQHKTLHAHYENYQIYLHLKKEFIFVNDGSSDKTLLLLKKKFKNKKNIKIVNYNQNKG